MALKMLREKYLSWHTRRFESHMNRWQERRANGKGQFIWNFSVSIIPPYTFLSSVLQTLLEARSAGVEPTMQMFLAKVEVMLLVGLFIWPLAASLMWSSNEKNYERWRAEQRTAFGEEG
jgi:hypothetical protein